MSLAMLELLKRQPPAKCQRCFGRGIVTVYYSWMWSPQVCYCGTCGGSGHAPQPQEQS